MRCRDLPVSPPSYAHPKTKQNTRHETTVSRNVTICNGESLRQNINHDTSQSEQRTKRHSRKVVRVCDVGLRHIMYCVITRVI